MTCSLLCSERDSLNLGLSCEGARRADKSVLTLSALANGWIGQSTCCKPRHRNMSLYQQPAAPDEQQEDLSYLLQMPADFDLEAEPEPLTMLPSLLAPADARLQLVDDLEEDPFLVQLAQHFNNVGSPEDSQSSDAPPQGQGKQGKQQQHQQEPARSKAQQAAELRAKNRLAQRKSRARKKVCVCPSCSAWTGAAAACSSIAGLQL